MHQISSIVYPSFPGRLGLAALVGLLLPLQSASAQNLLANPGFEEPSAAGGDVNTITGWDAFGWDQLHWITAQVGAEDGSQCLKLFGPWNQYGGVGATQTFPAAPGQTWVANIWSLNYSGDPMAGHNFCVMKIEFHDAAMVLVGGAPLTGINVFESDHLADAATPRDIWTLHGLGTAPAPEGTAYVMLVLVEVQMDNPPSGGSVFLDDAVLRQANLDPCALHDPVFDLNDDHQVDDQERDAFAACATGPEILLPADATQTCKCMDRDGDGDVDQADYGFFQRCYTGSTGTVDPACDNP